MWSNSNSQVTKLMVHTFAFLTYYPVLRLMQAIRTRNPPSKYETDTEYFPYSQSVSIKKHFIQFSSITVTC